MPNKQGYILYSKNKVKVSWRDMYSSLIPATILARQIVDSAQYSYGRLLDVGCGNKPYLPAFEQQVDCYLGLDLPTSGYGSEQIDVFGDAHGLPFKADSFDTVLCLEVLEHLSDPWEALAEIYRVMRPGGCLILSAPQTFFLHEQPYDFYRYTKYGLLHLVESSGFTVKSIQPTGGILSFAADFFCKLILFSFYFLNAIKYRLFGEESASLTRFTVVQFVIALPGMIFLWLSAPLRWIGRKFSDRKAFRKLSQLVAEAGELMTFGHVLVAVKEQR